MGRLKLITIDGPSASGKSSVSRVLAKNLGWPWLSTGIFYRGVARAFVKKNLSGDLSKGDRHSFKKHFSGRKSTSGLQEFSDTSDLSSGKLEKPLSDLRKFSETDTKSGFFGGLKNLEALLCLISESNWKVLMDENKTRFIFEGEDLTSEIFSLQIALMASHISHIPEVRQALLKPQRDCFNSKRGLVAEGRDCGSFVFPKAPLKVYLTAKKDTRGKRRHEQNSEGQKGHVEANIESLSQTLSAQEFRDREDSTRKTAPLKIPEGALVIDSTFLNLNQVVDQILDHAKRFWSEP